MKVQNHFIEGRWAFSANGSGEIGHPQAKTQSKQKYTYLIQQFNSECFIDLNVKYKTIRLLQSIKIKNFAKYPC